MLHACPTTGALCEIFIAPAAGTPPVAIPRAQLAPGHGIEGDRYFSGAGSFSRWPGAGRAVSLIAQESIDAIRSEQGIDLSAGRHRRNLVTRGVALDQLIGRRFRIGSVLLRGERLCLPCRHLERLTEAGVYIAMKYRGGLRADVLEAGAMCLGDSVEILPLKVR
jgi:MOSC domain-containing protein YiiM